MLDSINILLILTGFNRRPKENSFTCLDVNSKKKQVELT